MKNSVSLFMIFLLMCSSPLFSQNTETTAKPPAKTSQATLYNDIYAGYGALSIFYFTGRMAHSNDYPTENKYSNTKFPDQASSPGTFFLGYARTLNKVVSVGFLFGYQNFSYTGTGHITNYGSDSLINIKATDQLVTGIARVTFCYLNKPFIRMYSGVGLGLTIDFGKALANGEQTNERKLYPGGQLTLMGLRFGRAFGGFLEFGFGSYGILNVGLNYKFSD
ncbi:MAG: hypothetical protein NTW10_05160 [Bacteroidetes bacterium]|nr:hypothetical protein [Bacteroidota bacterium]